MDTQISFKWNEEEYEDFRKALAQLQADGKVDPAVNRSEAIRRLLENWSDDPDPELLQP
jgi:ATP-dependent Clp protease ATP-binding subunit ClpA